MICPDCGTTIDDDNKLCNKCAQEFNSSTPSTSHPQPQLGNGAVSAPRQKAKGKTIKIAAVLVIAVLIVAALTENSWGGRNNGPSVPGSPNGVTVLAGDSRATLNWTAPANDGGSAITGFNIYRSTISGEEILLASIGNESNFSDGSLINGQAYYYMVSSLNKVGESTRSSEVLAISGWTPSASITLSTVDSKHALFTIESISSSVSASYFSVNVTPSSGLTVVPAFGTSGTNNLAIGDHIFVNDTVGTTRYNLTISYDPTGFVAGSIEWTTSVGTPQVPHGLTVVSSTVQASLNWTAPANDGGSAITGFNVYRATGSGSFHYLTTVTSTSYLDADLTTGQTYSYKVSAVNSYGEGPITAGAFTKPSPQNDLLKAIVSSGQLVVGTQVPHALFEYLNATSGVYEGIDIEVAQRIADSLNVTLVIKPMDMDPLIAAVMLGKVDMAISAITINAEMEKIVNFTAPCYPLTQAVVVKDTSSIANIDDLIGDKIAVIEGTDSSSWAMENLVQTGRVAQADYSEYSDADVAAILVESGQKDAFVMEAPVAYAYAADPSNHLKVAFTMETDQNYGICIQKNQPNFRNALNEVISGMRADGSMDALLLKYQAMTFVTPPRGFMVQDVTGTVDTTDYANIITLTVQMRLKADSPSLNMNLTSIQFISGSVNDTLTFAETPIDGFCYGATTYDFHSPIWSGSSHIVKQGDMIAITITGLSLGYSAAVALKITPAGGSTTLVSFVTPAYYSVQYVNLV